MFGSILTGIEKPFCRENVYIDLFFERIVVLKLLLKNFAALDSLKNVRNSQNRDSSLVLSVTRALALKILVSGELREILLLKKIFLTNILNFLDTL